METAAQSREACTVVLPSDLPHPTNDWLADLEELSGDDVQGEAYKREAGTSAAFEYHTIAMYPSTASSHRDCLLALPLDLQLPILSQLSQRDLAALSCAGSRARAVTQHDALWSVFNTAAHQRPSRPPLAPQLSVPAKPCLECSADCTCSALPGVHPGRLVDVLVGEEVHQARTTLSTRHGQHKLLLATFRASLHRAQPDDASTLDSVERLLSKSMALAVRLGIKLGGLWQTHDQVRVALCALWDAGTGPSLMGRYVLKLTRFNWALAYEAICCAMVHRADCIALGLAGSYIGEGSGPSTASGGHALWSAVLAAWRRYRDWLARVVGCCPLLAECVSAERAAEMQARGRPDTPSLPGAGHIAFRSQVLLCYALRGPLQAALLALQARPGPSAAFLMIDVQRLLEELDIADDRTRPEACHTHEKLRRCFGLEPHTGQLQRAGPLRVPPLR